MFGQCEITIITCFYTYPKYEISVNYCFGQKVRPICHSYFMSKLVYSTLLSCDCLGSIICQASVGLNHHAKYYSCGVYNKLQTRCPKNGSGVDTVFGQGIN